MTSPGIVEKLPNTIVKLVSESSQHSTQQQHWAEWAASYLHYIIIGLHYILEDLAV